MQINNLQQKVTKNCWDVRQAGKQFKGIRLRLEDFFKAILFIIIIRRIQPEEVDCNCQNCQDNYFPEVSEVTPVQYWHYQVINAENRHRYNNSADNRRYNVFLGEHQTPLSTHFIQKFVQKNKHDHKKTEG